MTAAGPRRIAIVGLGPKGFGCLERLAMDAADASHTGPLLVTVHDPAPHPGAGPIYDPRQPRELLLNFSARHVDVWSPENRIVDAYRRPDLLTWLARRHPQWADPDAYVPRALVGRYLEEAYATLRAAMPARVRLTHVLAVVTDLTRANGRWRVHHEDPRYDVGDVDEVMVTVGHGTWTQPHRPGGTVPTTSAPTDEEWITSLPGTRRTGVVPAAFPVRSRLDPLAVPPDSRVGVRGFALSWIDVTLSLTSVRGGRFSDLDTPFPNYLGADDDVACIRPFSRSGQPLLAKPGPGLVARSAELVEVWDGLRREVAGQEGDPVDVAVLQEQLERSAATALWALRPGTYPAALSEASRLLEEKLSDRPPTRSGAAGVAAVRTMRHSVEVAHGWRPPDAAWALGEAWRQVYPPLVARSSHGGVPVTVLATFRRLARVMERLAFGPPVDNVARMLALVDAGRLDLRFVRAPALVEDHGHIALTDGRLRAPVDVLVDAVLPAPGVPEGDSLASRLVARGEARIGADGLGLEVTASAACVGSEGTLTRGLSAVGRLTEGWVLGNDTLSRVLHPQTAAWSRRVIFGPDGVGRETSSAVRATER